LRFRKCLTLGGLLGSGRGPAGGPSGVQLGDLPQPRGSSPPGGIRPREGFLARAGAQQRGGFPPRGRQWIAQWTRLSAPEPIERPGPQLGTLQNLRLPPGT